MKTIRSSFSNLVVRAFLVGLVSVLIVGCQSVNRLREAQASFNDAASQDLQLAFSSNAKVGENLSSEKALVGWANVRTSYGSALVSLNRIGLKDRRVLEKENLWGAKLALEAMCHWKLGNYEKALEMAEEARRSDQLYPRDQTVMDALPALIMIDHAYDLRAAKTDQIARTAEATNLVRKVRTLTVDDKGAVGLIEDARKQRVVDSNLHVFLIQSQLAAYRNYRRTYELIDNRGPETNSAPHLAAQRQLNELAALVRGASGRALINHWASIDSLRSAPVAD